MSIKVMSWVWENVNLKASHKLVLLALSDNANDEGVCWPSIRTVARKCGLSDRYTKDILSDLRHDGYLNIEYRKDGEKNQTNLYTVRWGGIPPQGGEVERPIGGEADIPRVGRQASPKSSVNHHIEPPIEPSFNPPAAEKPNREDAYRERIKQAMQKGESHDIEVKQKVYDLFHISPNWSWKGNRAFLEWAKKRKDGEIEHFAEWWYAEDWRGKTGQPPSLAQVMELWPQAFSIARESPIDRMVRLEREVQGG